MRKMPILALLMNPSTHSYYFTIHHGNRTFAR